MNQGYGLSLAAISPRQGARAALGRSCLSANGIATIDDERVPDHKTRKRAAEPQDRIRDFLGPADTPDGHLFQHGIESLGLAAGFRLIGHRRVAQARTDGVHADTLGGILLAHLPTLPADRRLARRKTSLVALVSIFGIR